MGLRSWPFGILAFLLLAFGFSSCGDPEVLGLFAGGRSTGLSVSIISPSDGQVITTNQLVVTGTVSDPSGWGISGVYFSYDGGEFTLLSGTVAWSTNLTGIALGVRTIRVYATDGMTNYSPTNQVSFTYTTGPLIAISSPSNGAVLRTNTVRVSGSATDQSSTGIDTVFLSLDGGGFTPASGTASWSSNFAFTQSGAHTVRTYGTDNQGNYSLTNEVSFTVAVSPVASFVSPASNQVFQTNGIAVSGTASDYSGTGLAGVYLSVDGGGYGLVSGLASWSTNLIGLSESAHTLRVYARDNAGNYGQTNQISFEVATWGPYANLYTLIVANGTDLRISTNGYNNFYSITDAGLLIVGCSVDRYRNIYVTSTNSGGDNTGHYGVVRGFSSSIDYSTYTTGNAAGICANDDYGHFYSYEVSGTAVGGPYSSDFGTNMSWIGDAVVGQSDIGVCYVACNPSGYAVLGRNNGTLSVRSGGSGTFTTVDPDGNTNGAHQMALTTNMPPTITFIEYGQNLHSSDDGYTSHDVGAYVSSLYYKGQRLWIGFSGQIAYSDNHGRNLTYPGSSGLPAEDITAIAIDSTGRVFVGTRAGKLYTSNDTGASFTSVANWGDYISQIKVID